MRYERLPDRIGERYIQGYLTRSFARKEYGKVFWARMLYENVGFLCSLQQKRNFLPTK